jgi:hypothetical protein
MVPTISTAAATSASIGANRPSRKPNGACGGTTTTPVTFAGRRAAKAWTAVAALEAAHWRPLGPALQLTVRHREQRIGHLRAAARDHAAVVEHDEERMVVLRVLLVHVLREIGFRLALEQVGEVEGDRLAEPHRRLARQAASRLRHRPREQNRLYDEHRRQEADNAECETEVKAAVPAHGTGIGD